MKGLVEGHSAVYLGTRRLPSDAGARFGLWKGLVASAVGRPEIARMVGKQPTDGAARDEAFCLAMLPRVSRTFALSILALRPACGSRSVSPYLLCRIVDTIEDDPKIAGARGALFDAFDAALASGDGAEVERLARDADLGASADERELARGAASAFRVFRVVFGGGARRNHSARRRDVPRDARVCGRAPMRRPRVFASRTSPTSSGTAASWRAPSAACSPRCFFRPFRREQLGRFRTTDDTLGSTSERPVSGSAFSSSTS